MPPASKNIGLRKAAIFVASLDRATADRVLDQMPPEQARLVRAMLMDLDEIDPEEQRRVIEEFRRGAPSQRKAESGVELDRGLAERIARSEPAPVTAAKPVAAPAGPFGFLRETEAEKLAKVLAAERPQVIALVLSHLAPEQAGNVLVRLPPTVQADVLHRLVDLEEADPEILREVERVLQVRLSQTGAMPRRRGAGLSAVAGIIEASGQQIGAQILGNLGRFDRSLADRLAPARPDLTFEDLVRLDDQTLAAVLGAAELEVVMLALLGAQPQWIERFVGLLPEAEARVVRNELASPGPIRLSDVEESRRLLAELAGRMATEGKISLPRRPPLAA